MYVSESVVRAHLTYDALIPAIRQALLDYSAGRVEQPPRTILRAGNAEGAANGWFAVMPVIAGDVMGVKTVTFYPGNADLAVPTHMAMVEVLSRSTGEPLAVMDGRRITEMRTAAVSAVAFAALAPLHFDMPPTTLGILGSGVQAHAHIEAFRRVWPTLNDICIWSPTTAHAQRLADATSARAVSIEEAASSQVVLTATSAAVPVLQGNMLSPHALTLAVGATGNTLRELDDDVMHSSFIVAESRSCVERESGDLRLSGARVSAEIGEILANPNLDAIPRAGRVLFKSVGMAIEDLTAARIVWQAINASQSSRA
ncbi:MAG TPA: ornithine cyclodeaminase family protein [Terracidiphilus sp.]|jgi:ornithine cyclodeaminase/alanine dehydrogenase-like protein (mu-crystallin family)|nr:ornithine cyclodeaminase family protein [Terracidiphilus sp.]